MLEVDPNINPVVNRAAKAKSLGQKQPSRRIRPFLMAIACRTVKSRSTVTTLP